MLGKLRSPTTGHLTDSKSVICSYLLRVVPKPLVLQRIISILRRPKVQREAPTNSAQLTQGVID